MSAVLYADHRNEIVNGWAALIRVGIPKRARVIGKVAITVD